MFVKFVIRLQQVKATSIFAQEEVEYHLRMMMGIVDETLATTNFEDGKPNMCLWQTPFYDIKVVFLPFIGV